MDVFWQLAGDYHTNAQGPYTIVHLDKKLPSRRRWSPSPSRAEEEPTAVLQPQSGVRDVEGRCANGAEGRIRELGWATTQQDAARGRCERGADAGTGLSYPLQTVAEGGSLPLARRLKPLLGVPPGISATRSSAHRIG